LNPWVWYLGPLIFDDVGPSQLAEKIRVNSLKKSAENSLSSKAY